MGREDGYRVAIRVRGELAPSWSPVFAGLEIETAPDGTTPDGTTLVAGEVADQAALHGLLDAIRDLGLSLVSVRVVAISHPARK